MGYVAAAILAVALIGVLLRPQDLHESVYAALGALAMVVVGAESATAAGRVVRVNLAVFAFLAGVMLLASAADQAGVFGLAARGAVRLSGGRIVGLFWLVVIIAFVGTMTLSLDAVAVALTPVVVTLAVRYDAPAEPLLFACIAVANTASIALPGANPTNVVVSQRLGIGFADYALVMVPVALAASVAAALALRLRFRRDLQGSFRTDHPAPAADALGATIAAAAAAATLVGFVLLPHDLGWVALSGGVVATLAALARRRLHVGAALEATAPKLLVFALGMFVLVDGAERHGLRQLVLDHAPASFGTLGVVAAGLANLVNNLPATLLVLPATHDDPTRAYAAIVGVDAGPNLALSGSLATLLWITMARNRDIDVQPRRYLAVGLLTAPIAVAAGLVVLWGLR